MRNFFLLLVLGCIFVAAPAFAQELDETYTAPDDSFEFLYPSDWEVDDSLFEDIGFIVLSGDIGRDGVFFTFLSPEFVDTMAPDARDVEDISDALSDIFQFDNEETYDIDGREVVIANYELEDSGGIAFVMDLEDGGFGAVLVSAEDGDSFEDEDFFNTVIAVALSYNSLGANGGGNNSSNNDDDNNSSNSNSSSGDFPEELRDFDGDWQDAIAELEDEAVIASGGTLIFNENSAFFDGIGSWFTPLARRSERRDVIMAATLEFTSDSRDYESCSIMARIQDDGSSTVNTYLEVGIDNDGQAYWGDSHDGDYDYDTANLDLDLDEAHHVLFIAQLDRLNVYIDGELVFDNARIEERSGYFGISLIGRGADSRCEGTNVWAYDAPAFVEGLCEVVAAGTVNKRSGPGTDFDRDGTMNAGERLEVVGQAEDSAGFVWYELEDDSWVREDVISLQGDCGDIPESD